TTEIVNGQPIKKQVAHRLVPVGGEYRSERDVRPLADEHLRPLNLGAITAEGSLTVTDFVEKYFLPAMQAKKKPSTHKFYRDLVKNHINPLLGTFRLREVTTRDVQRLLDARAHLSQPSVLRIKTGASALLSHAIRLGFLQGTNVAREARAEGKRSDPNTYAYTLSEVVWMLERLPEPARAVVATAAFSGLRESELRGLQWADYDGQFLDVQRSVWRTHVGDVKTDESKKKVPVIDPLRKILDAHRRRDGASKWIFAGDKMGRPLHLDNLARRIIRPVVGDRWHGWHAFRRGLGTVLFDLGVPAEIAAVILRHADASITIEHYILLKSQRQGRAAMRRLGRIVKQKLSSPTRRRRSNPRK
ncbi:MAG TPA: tyrosine-type recombinase/integrase, partial [Terriglobales bacterium]|nr:tyrosine-type recombinase/integrase [Terriglobales bacterium]